MQISCAVTAQLISGFVFATWIVQSLFYLNPKFQASSYLLWVYSRVCVRPGRKPRRPVFSQRGSNIKCSELLTIKCTFVRTINLVYKGGALTYGSLCHYEKQSRPLRKHLVLLWENWLYSESCFCSEQMCIVCKNFIGIVFSVCYFCETMGKFH